jgi:hypothetical protein
LVVVVTCSDGAAVVVRRVVVTLARVVVGRAVAPRWVVTVVSTCGAGGVCAAA